MILNLFPLLIPTAPLLAALFTVFSLRNDRFSIYLINSWFMIVSFVASLLLLIQAIQYPDVSHLALLSPNWSFLPEVNMSVDRLTSVMMLFISGFGVILYRYSIRYLQQDLGYGRYLTLLTLCISSLLFLVSCSDFVMLFIFWQLLSWFLALLSHNYSHGPTIKSGFRTFIILRAGDLIFLSGIALAYNLYGTLEFNLLFQRASIDKTMFSFFGTGIEFRGTTIVTLLIFVGAMSKSAQMPLHMWVPDSLFAPTPVHALLHAGLINVGGFLLARLAPLYSLSSTTLHIVLFVGLLTAILATSVMLVQNDIKKTLGYSTIGQMGYMMMACGFGAFHFAVFHLIAHGLFKADVFLNIGKGIHNTRLNPSRPPEISELMGFSFASLISAFTFSLFFPILILSAVHYVLDISYLDYHALLIFLLFSWACTSQAMLTLVRFEEPFKTKISMLGAISLIGTAYFFAAESFAHFLIVDPTKLKRYLLAGELPFYLFMMLVFVIIFSIFIAWFFSLYRSSYRTESIFFRQIKRGTYLFLLNRLYLDHLSEQVFYVLRMCCRKLYQTHSIFLFFLIIPVLFVYWQTISFSEISIKTTAIFLISSACLPLFPFHGFYVTCMKKASRIFRLGLALAAPFLGIYLASSVISEIPKEFLPVITILALVSALWATIKAVFQLSILHLITYGAVALYSIFWLHIAQLGSISDYAISYVWSLTILIWGFFLAIGQLFTRYGELEINDIAGLFRKMPYFSVLFGLLIMAAVGLPPFTLFFSYLGILINHSNGISSELVGIILIWFMSCWYFFKLMQSILFGISKENISYKDFTFSEITLLIAVLMMLTIPFHILVDWLNSFINLTGLMIGPKI